MRELGNRQLNEVHIEAGFKLNGSLLREGIVDELLVYLAPSLVGDRAHGMFNLSAMTSLDERHRLAISDVQRIGEDIRVLARVLGPKASVA